MDCPRCGTRLEIKNISEVEVDECPDCKGSWFEEDELRKAKDSTDVDLNWMDVELWKDEELYKPRSTRIGCPKCEGSLVAIDYGETRVEIDYCPECRGVWLDKDEFKTIVEELNREVNEKSFSDYVRASIREAKEIVTGPESFVSEWRDFITVFRLMQYRLFVENPRLRDALVEIQRSNPLR